MNEGPLARRARHRLHRSRGARAARPLPPPRQRVARFCTQQNTTHIFDLLVCLTTLTGFLAVTVMLTSSVDYAGCGGLTRLEALPVEEAEEEAVAVISPAEDSGSDDDASAGDDEQACREDWRLCVVAAGWLLLVALYVLGRGDDGYGFLPGFLHRKGLESCKPFAQKPARKCSAAASSHQQTLSTGAAPSAHAAEGARHAAGHVHRLSMAQRLLHHGRDTMHHGFDNMHHGLDTMHHGLGTVHHCLVETVHHGFHTKPLSAGPLVMPEDQPPPPSNLAKDRWKSLKKSFSMAGSCGQMIAGHDESPTAESLDAHEVARTNLMTVTFGRRLIVASVQERCVAIPLLRLGPNTKEVKVLICTVDATAKLGQDYHAPVVTAAPTMATAPDEERSHGLHYEQPGTIVVTFPPHLRLIHVYVPLDRDRPSQANVADANARTFLLNLHDFSADDECSTGPILQTTVRLVHDEHFPLASPAPLGSQRSGRCRVQFRRAARSAKLASTCRIGRLDLTSLNEDSTEKLRAPGCPWSRPVAAPRLPSPESNGAIRASESEPHVNLADGTRVRHFKHGAGTVTQHMEDGRTRVTFDSGEEHRYEEKSIHKLVPEAPSRTSSSGTTSRFATSEASENSKESTRTCPQSSGRRPPTRTGDARLGGVKSRSSDGVTGLNFPIGTQLRHQHYGGGEVRDLLAGGRVVVQYHNGEEQRYSSSALYTMLQRELVKVDVVHHIEGAKVKAPRRLLERARFIRSFLRRMFRLKGMPRRVLAHQLSRVWLAIDGVILQSMLLALLLEHGINKGRYDVTVALALIKLTLLLIKFRIELNYFHGSFLVLQHLRSMLLRKYLQISQHDREVEPTIEGEFRLAINTTANDIRENTWKALFHHGLPALYRALASFIYVFLCLMLPRPIGGDAGNVSIADRALIVFAVLVSVVVFCAATSAIYFGAVQSGWLMWRRHWKLQTHAEVQLQSLLSSWRHIQQEGAEDAHASAMFDAFWVHIRQGDYPVWYHLFTARWKYRTIVGCGVAALWCFAPAFKGNVAFYVPLLNVLNVLASSMLEFEERMLQMLESGAQITKVSSLLNLQASELVEAQSRSAEERGIAHASGGGGGGGGNGLEACEGVAAWCDPLSDALSSAMGRLAANDADVRDLATALAEVTRAGEQLMLPGHGLEYFKDLSLRWMGEIMAGTNPRLSLELGGRCLLVHDVTLVYEGRTFFRNLHVHDLSRASAPATGATTGDAGDACGAGGDAAGDAAGVETAMLPAGRVVGLRSREGEGLVLLQLLSHALRAQRGAALCTMRAQLVTGRDSIVTDRRPVIYHLMGDGGRFSDRHPSEARLWQLCRRLGMPTDVIGAEFGRGWMSRVISPGRLEWDAELAVKLSLARALLAHPDALLLHGLCDGWAIQRQRALIGVVRAWLSGALDALTHSAQALEDIELARSPYRKRSAVWCASELTLGLLLDEPTDLVLTVETPHRAVLQTTAQAGLVSRREGRHV